MCALIYDILFWQECSVPVFPVRFTTVTVRPGDFRLPLRTAGARKAPHVPADPQSAVTSEGVKKCPVKQKREGAAEFHAAAGSRSGKY